MANNIDWMRHVPTPEEIRDRLERSVGERLAKPIIDRLPKDPTATIEDVEWQTIRSNAARLLAEAIPGIPQGDRLTVITYCVRSSLVVPKDPNIPHFLGNQEVIQSQPKKEFL